MTAPATAYEGIRRDVLDRLEAGGLDPERHGEAVRELVEAAVDRYQASAHLGNGTALHDPTAMADRVVRAIGGFGPLSEILRRSDVEEIFIEGERVTYLDRTGRLLGLNVPTTADENRQVVDRLLATSERHLDAKNPLVQARVLDGRARLTAAIPPVTDLLSATIRRHASRRETMASLVSKHSLTPEAAGFLWAAMRTITNVLVSGPPGAGKTSLLAALLSAVPSSHCVRSCEEIRELHVPLTHGGYYESRPPALDGSGEVSLRALVKFVLAMRPDRIVVGEVRGAEAFELTRAVNAGCGFACTVHANSARDSLTAIVNAALMAGENVTERIVRRVFTSAIDLVVHCERDLEPSASGRGLRREVTEIIALTPALHDDFSTDPIFVRDGLGKPLFWTGILPPGAERMERALPEGMTLRSILEGRRSPL
ncbi:MAG: CpaF family protein [Nitriliruptorales bacterium]